MAKEFDGYAKEISMRESVLCHREKNDKNRIIFMIYRYSAALDFVIIFFFFSFLPQFGSSTLVFGHIILYYVEPREIRLYFDPFSIVAAL